MILEFFVSDTAEKQITSVKAWYEIRSVGLGDAFEQELDRAFTAIRTFPRATTLIRGKLRQAPMSRFPYVIMLQLTSTRMVILRVVHGKRHPKHRIGRSGKP